MPFDLQSRFIDTAEAELQTTFPVSYRTAMQRSNGGSISAADDNWELYPIADSSDKKRLSRTSNSVVSETRSARNWSGFPRNAVALASNGSGDVLIFLLESEGLGDAVFIWRHEDRSLSQVAADFSDLF